MPIPEVVEVVTVSTSVNVNGLEEVSEEELNWW